MGKRKPKNQIKIGDFIIENNAIFLHYYNRLKQLAITHFKWHNLPDTIDERFLELTLFERGSCVYFHSDINNNPLMLATMPSGKWNVYRIPLYNRAQASNGFSQDLNIDNSVICWNDYLRQSLEKDIVLFAYQLYQAKQAVNSNLSQQKFSTIIKTSEQQRLTMKNIMAQHEGNVPFILADKGVDYDTQVFNANVPYLVDKIDTHLANVWNEALTFLGINNANTQKKERLVTNEVDANDQHIYSEEGVRLKARLDFCEQVYKMFPDDFPNGKPYVTRNIEKIEV